LPAGRAHIFFCLKETLEQIPVADLDSGTSSFYIDVADSSLICRAADMPSLPLLLQLERIKAGTAF